jgi:bifunctional non-homologous end joining protein LigD
MRRFQGLADSLARVLPISDAILDGEIVVMRDHLPDFLALMFRRGEPEYAAFDLLFLNGRDLRDLPYSRREAKLKSILSKQDVIGFVEQHSRPELFEAAARLDLEGVVAKRVDDPYVSGTEWLKVKHAEYTQAEGRWELFSRAGR